MKQNLPGYGIISILSRRFLCVLFLFYFSYSQAQTPCKFSLSCKNMPLEEVLITLRNQCDLTFSYNPDAIPLSEKLSLQFQDKSLEETLDILGESCGIGYVIRSNRIVLYRDLKRRQVIVNGFVQDSESGEQLIAARVVDLKSGRGVLTNDYGFFSLKLPADSVCLIINYATYKPLRIPLFLKKNTQLKVELAPDYELNEVEIIADEMRILEGDYDPGEMSISIREMKVLPALLGEMDIVKNIQLLPGIQAGREGSSGLYIRGGGPDQNLVLLDGVPLYYVSHLGGFFSIFNADALNGMKLIKGGFPARYGGRLSSVLDVHMKEGNMKELKGEGSLGILTGKISLEGPLKKDKCSFIVSARRSYLDLILGPIINRISDDRINLGYAFYDLNAKINYVLSPKDRFYLSMYAGHDKTESKIGFQRTNSGANFKETIKQETSNLVKWGNYLVAGRWNHIWSPKLFSNLTGTYGYYTYQLHNDHRYEFEEEFSRRRSVADYKWRFNSGIQDIGLKLDFDFYPHPRHEVKFGGGAMYHRFQPGFAKISFRSNFEQFEDFRYQSDSALIQSIESHIYLEDRWKLTSRLKLHTGMHAVYYRVGKQNYPTLQPRVSMLWHPVDRLHMKLAYSSMAQYVHLLTNPGADLPSDRWVPATENIPPQRSHQVSLGTWYHTADGDLQFSLEGYYKTLQNLIAYQSADDFYNQAVKWQDFVEKDGTGETYGLEFLARKVKGKFTGWIGYTLSWNYRTFENLNGGKPFPYRYDRRHDISIALVHQLNDRVGLSANWVFGTGNAITLTSGIHNSWMQDVGGSSIFDIQGLVGIPSEERNGFRMGNYHRLDLAIQLSKKTNWGERSWHLGVYNAYNRRNPYYYFYVPGTQQLPNGQSVFGLSLFQFSFFSLLPAISYHFSF